MPLQHPKNQSLLLLNETPSYTTTTNYYNDAATNSFFGFDASVSSKAFQKEKGEEERKK
jgi:hypothetical protein